MLNYNMEVLNKETHTPAMLKMATKENNIILSKENRSAVALSGTSGFGSNKTELQVDLASSQVIDGTSLQLRGSLQVAGDYTNALRFNGDAYSLISQISIDYNGQSILNLTQDADYVANLNRTLHEGANEARVQDFMALKDVSLNNNGPHDFCLDLSKYGSKLSYYLITGSVGKLKIRISFQRDLARLFHGAEQTGTSVTGYSIDNCEVCADYLSFDSKVYDGMVKTMRGPSGIQMPTHTFIVQRNEMLPGNTNHNIQGSFQYRNVVSVYYMPVETSITANASGISNTDIIGNLTYAGNKFPTDQRIRFSGLNYVNQNGNLGESTPSQHLTGILKSVRTYPDSNDVAYKLVDKYRNSYQVTGASFVRGDNLVSITNSGVIGFTARGILENSFTTSQSQTGKSLIQIGVVTSVVNFVNGNVEVLI